MKTWFMIACMSALVVAGAITADAGVSIQIGTNDFYLSVGDYDYLPYAYENDPGYVPPQINFNVMMSEYGRWVSVSPFGQVWRPYASSGWRPYTYGHWIYTEYGPYWEGYEPWAWVGYHYGSWIFTGRYGWAWVPGYDWHPGRVAWARGIDTIGWMPRPPDGYDYHRGSLTYVGAHSQFSYSDGDFGEDFGSDSYSYGGPYYDPRARDMYYNPSYASVNFNLWVFIGGANFGQDNYADYELGPDYTRYAFDQKTVRISNQPMEQGVLESITRQQIQRAPVDVRELRTDKRTIRVVVPSGNAPAERLRVQSPGVVRQVIAPAFAQEQKQFKGNASKIQAPVARIFRQENVQPRVETRSNQQVIDAAREAQKNREQIRIQNVETAKQLTEKLKQLGKIKEPKKDAGRAPINPNENRPAAGTPPRQQNAPVQPVNIERNPAPRPVIQNERTVAPPPAPSAQTSPTSPAPAPQPTQPDNPAAFPRPMQSQPTSEGRPSTIQTAHSSPTTATPASRPTQPENPAASPRPMNPSDRPAANPRETGGRNADASITSQALAAVRTNLPTVARGISIQTKDGIVTVSGKAGSAADAQKLIQLISGVNGVKSVKNQLSIQPAKSR